MSEAVAGSVIIIHGPTRAGKSWQAKHLASGHSYRHISSGDLLRATTDQKILRKMSEGHLVLSEDVEQLVFAALKEVPASQPIVLDGFPRKLNEFHNLERELTALGRPIQRVLEVYIPPEESHARAEHRAREDDDKEAIERKWQWYTNDTKRVLDYCQEKGWLRVVDGVGTHAEVAARIESAL